ncbi:hypothetical protein O181_037498 [Austropuccinia psidii MF-1]|uniref:Uncharacterized protein n=1 Tax=Austropuccinia psidii MF-1 TaxID=1389203 RepID=A0A9Q3HA56_9BASI|nr:hypothetical protein [Austropuccinia psidii MF-1]
MKTTHQHMLRWQIAIQELRVNMSIRYKEGTSPTNAADLSILPLENVKINLAYDSQADAKIPIHFMEIDRRKNFTFSEWAAEFGISDSNETKPEGTETPILRTTSSDLNNKFFSSVIKTCAKHKHCSIMLQLLHQRYRSLKLEFHLEEPWSSVTTMAIHLLGSPYGISSHSSFMANWPYPSPVANMAICVLGPSWPFTSIQSP